MVKKLKFNKSKFLCFALLFVFILFFSACSSDVNQNSIKEQNIQNSKGFQNTTQPNIVIYNEYINKGFSVIYPNWPKAIDSDKSVEVSVTKGVCSVIVNAEDIPVKNWYNYILDGVNKDNESQILFSDDENLNLEFSSKYLNFDMVTKARLYECNSKSYTVMVVCVNDSYLEMKNISNKVFGSVLCNKSDSFENDNKISYLEFKDSDFSVDYPNWQKLEDNQSNSSERVLGVTKGVCSILVNKYNALPSDMASWVKKAVDEKEGHSLLKYLQKDDVFYIDYSFDYNGQNITAKSKIYYCNYMSYDVISVCVDSLMTEELEEMNDKVLDSVNCDKKYEVLSLDKVKDEKIEVTQKEPEVVKEIEEEIVKTNIGEEFGIDEDMVVYFVNNNEFFRKITKDFSKVNLVFEDKENNRELKLKVKINSDNGKIELVEDGEYDNSDVTLIIPIRDALNIFSNAANINPVTLIGFAINVKTDPPKIKNEVIGKVLRGEYN